MRVFHAIFIPLRSTRFLVEVCMHEIQGIPSLMALGKFSAGAIRTELAVPGGRAPPIKKYCVGTSIQCIRL